MMNVFRPHKMTPTFKRSFGRVRRPRMMGMSGVGGHMAERAAPFTRAARKAYAKRQRKGMMR